MKQYIIEQKAPEGKYYEFIVGIKNNENIYHALYTPWDEEISFVSEHNIIKFKGNSVKDLLTTVYFFIKNSKERQFPICKEFIKDLEAV